MTNRPAFAFLSTIFVPLASLALGYGLVYLFMGQTIADDLSDLDKFRLANLPVTPLTALDSRAGTGRIVRIQGKISTQPPLTNDKGEKLAFKAVTQTDETGRSSVVEDEWWMPGTVEVTDGQTRVPVEIGRHIPGTSSELVGPDTNFLDRQPRGTIHDGKLPQRVAAWLGNDFANLKPFDLDVIHTYSLPQDVPVTVYGIVEREDGHLIVHAPQRYFLGKTSGRMIISALAPDKLAKKLRFDGYLAVFVAFCLMLPVLIVVWVLASARRQAKKTTPPDLSRLNG